MKKPRRQLEIDGLRGLAILLVVGYHYFARWPQLVPFGNAYSGFSLFKFGHLGVELFFMISGYVILMTLDASSGIKHFLWKRWARLFPAMAVASVLIFASAAILPGRPGSAPVPVDFLPGLFFIDEFWFDKLLGMHVRSLEGSFWSLYVEVRFYIIVSAVYFLAGRSRALFALVSLAGASAVLHLLVQNAPHVPPVVTKLYWWVGIHLVGKYAGWFAIGMLAYESSRGHATRSTQILILLTSLFALVQRCNSLELTVMCTFTIVLFLAVALYGKLTKFFSGPVFGFFGMISYPLYLINEKTGIALIIMMGKLSIFPLMTLPLLALAILCVPAYVIAKYVEPAAQRILTRKSQKAKSIQPEPINNSAPVQYEEQESRTAL